MTFPRSFNFYARQIEYKSFFDEKAKRMRYFVKGHIDSEDLDLVNEIVTKACMRDISQQFKSRSIKLDYDHEALRKSSDEELDDMRINLSKSPLGKALTERLDDKGNLVQFELNPNYKKFDSKGNVVKTFSEVWAEIKSKYLDAFSIAYFPVRTTPKDLGSGMKARLLDKVNIINIALTGNPINPAASLTEAMTKSLEWIKQMEDQKKAFDKGGRMEAKAYAKDGGHAHTENDPLGEHNHPEIENALRSQNDWLHDRLDNISRRLSKLEGLGLESKEETMLKARGGKMPEEGDKPDDAAAAVEEGADKGAEDKPDPVDKGEGAPAEAAKKAKQIEDDLAEVKGKLGEFEKSNADLKSSLEKLEKENAELKGIVEKARPAGKGAEDKSGKTEAEAKSLGGAEGPLDLI